MSKLNTDIGIRIRQARKAHSLTQEEMSEKLGISVKHYGGAERGVTGLSVENLIAVSNILNVSLDYLLKGDEMSDNYIPSELKELYLDFPIEKRNHILKILELIHEINK